MNTNAAEIRPVGTDYEPKGLTTLEEKLQLSFETVIETRNLILRLRNRLYSNQDLDAPCDEPKVPNLSNLPLYEVISWINQINNENYQLLVDLCNRTGNV